MGRTHKRYPEEFRRRMVVLVRANRSPCELSREFEPSVEAIRSWTEQADRDEGRGRGETGEEGLTSAERDELARHRRENKQLRLERDILAEATAWFAQETGARPSGSSGS